MKKIVILSTDTAHHRYFINTIIKNGFPVTCCLFETSHAVTPFVTDPFFEKEENDFEKNHFFKSVSSGLNIDVFNVNTVNDKQSVELLRKIGPDFGIVFGTGKITHGTIELFKDGLINVHRGISQYYRGLDSALWAIYHGDYENIGVTIHRVDENLDTGEIVYQARFERSFLKSINIYELRYHTTIMATDLVIKSLNSYLKGELRPSPQPAIGRYCSFMPLGLKKIAAEKFERFSKNR